MEEALQACGRGRKSTNFFKVSYQSGTRIHLCTKSKSALGITAIKLEHFNHPDIGENGTFSYHENQELSERE
ncbi:hypothetical protein RRG08_049041 [Elysia crispata]|uniref:Uncharacterized protein n=1 Tax=Elysia crispata TaxID=231223 RepID=A0AAE0ZSY4_9GAST|nr:hypothetical protein RRG08_049041 [Elysia crispata]